MKAFIVRAIIIVISLLVMIQLWIFSSLLWWRTHPVKTTMFMRLDYVSDFKPIQHQWVDYDQISVHFKRAVVEAEDGQFLKHHGFDWDGIELARQRNLDKERVVAGGSTISQQLAKNLFFYNRRSYFRKGQEAIATVMMERMWSKQRILEVYMNSIEFGDHLYGVEAASQFYFGRSAQNLSREQAAFLTAILANPKYYQQNRSDQRVLYKKKRVLRYMEHSQIP